MKLLFRRLVLVVVLQNLGANFDTIATDVCPSLLGRRNQLVDFDLRPVTEGAS